MIRLLIADDQVMVREGFSALLDAQPDLDVVGTAGSGTEAVTLARRLKPDIVLMDVRMPGMDGIEATRRLNEPWPGWAQPPRVLVLTTFDLDDYVYEALRAGASGFLLKDAPADDLVRAVRVVSSGDALLAPSVTRRLVQEFARRPRRPASSSLRQLTSRETDVLRLVARGLSNAEIAEELFVAEQTVKSHVSRLFGKLGLRDRAQAVVLAYESGLVVAGDG
jgi:DNA-binding NarL/FixJ family response regulator